MRNTLTAFAATLLCAACSTIHVTSDPPGAEVYVRSANALGFGAGGWERIGQTPASASAGDQNWGYVVWGDGTKSEEKYSSSAIPTAVRWHFVRPPLANTSPAPATAETTARTAGTEVLAGSAGMSTQVQADLLKSQIVDAVSRNDNSAALELIRQFHDLKVQIPPVLLFTEAKLADEQREFIRAHTALEQYFRGVGPDDPSYDEATRLYPQIRRRADEARAGK